MRRVLAGLLVGAFAVAGMAMANSSFTMYIPHGEMTLPGNSSPCQTCHVTSTGPSLNAFGNDVKITLKDGRPDWRVLSQLDSDGDRLTNGVELGDPNGTWTVGAPRPSWGTVTNPANSSSPAREGNAPLAIQRVQVPTTWAVIKALFQ